MQLTWTERYDAVSEVLDEIERTIKDATVAESDDVAGILDHLINAREAAETVRDNIKPYADEEASREAEEAAREYRRLVS